MTGARKLRGTTRPTPAVTRARGVCIVCQEPRLCAVVDGSDVIKFCFTCALSMAQLVAGGERASRRPHAKPCTCEACVTFHEGQRGEVARVVMRPPTRISLVEVDL